MKKIFLLAYILISGCVLYAQVDSLTAWNAGKGIADGLATATGQKDTPWYAVVSTAAPVLFMWIWHVTHLKKKHKAEIERLKG